MKDRSSKQLDQSKNRSFKLQFQLKFTKLKITIGIQISPINQSTRR